MPFCPNSALFPKNNAPVSETRGSEILTVIFMTPVNRYQRFDRVLVDVTVRERQR